MLKKIFCLFIFCLLSAKADERTIVIKHKSRPSKAILNTKFLFLNEATSQSSPQSGSQGLKNLSTVNKSLSKSSLSKPNTLAKTSTKAPKPKSVYQEEDWENYAQEVELEEELGVSAKLKSW